MAGEQQEVKIAYRHLNAEYVYKALLDHGMFAAPQIPPCFTSELLSEKMEVIAKKFSLGSRASGEKQFAKDYVRYSAQGHALKVRDYGIPHPIAYQRLCFAIKKHWLDINKTCFVPHKKNFIHVRKIEGEPFIFKMRVGDETQRKVEDKKVRMKLGAQYVVKADISKCFPSIYTHAIAWGMVTKEKAKEYYRLGDGCVQVDPAYEAGNELDTAARNTTNGETHGLLIGPHASNILSELILTRVDKTLDKRLPRYTRYIDDYEFYAQGGGEAKDFLRYLRLYLGEYGMKTNDGKVSISKLPEVDVHWKDKLLQFQFPSFDDPEAEPREIGFPSINAYLQLAIALADTHEDAAPLNYAIKVIASSEEKETDDKYRTQLHLSSRGALNAAIAVLDLCVLRPYLCPHIENAIEGFKKHIGKNADNLQELNEMLSDFVQRLFEISMENSHTDALAYSLYFAVKCGVDLSKQLHCGKVNEILGLGDCVALVLLYEYASRRVNGENGSQFQSYKEQVVEYAREQNEDEQDRDKFWLLIYQCLDADDINDIWLKRLKLTGYSFMDWGRTHPVPTLSDYGG